MISTLNKNFKIYTFLAPQYPPQHGYPQHGYPQQPYYPGN
jgi:hypothetical protein